MNLFYACQSELDKWVSQDPSAGICSDVAQVDLDWTPHGTTQSSDSRMIWNASLLQSRLYVSVRIVPVEWLQFANDNLAGSLEFQSVSNTGAKAYILIGLDRTVPG